jgi:hypothetical protein
MKRTMKAGKKSYYRSKEGIVEEKSKGNEE